MGARREVVSAVTERYRSAQRAEKGRILDAPCATTGWHRKHAVRALRQHETVGPGEVEASRERRRRYGATIKDALTALWEASDRVCGKRLKVMIPTLLPALERHGRLQLGQSDRDRVLAISAATIDRLLVDVKIAASGGRRRRAGFHSAIRREVPIRTFNDWNSPPPGFCEVDMVAHGGTSVAGSFIQTLTMVDIATGWTECLPLLTRDGSLVAEAINRAQSLFPWLLRGVDFDNDSAFMNDVVVPWCRQQKLEVTRSRAYKKNDQAFVEQKNGAVVRRLMGYGRFDGVETARVMGRLYAAARLYVNFFQPSFKLKEKRREGAKVIKRYHAPLTPYQRALAHPKVTAAVKRRLRDQYRLLDPVALLAEIRATQDELGNRVDRRAGQARGLQRACTSTAPATAAMFAKTLGKTVTAGEPRATHRRTRRPYKTRVRMPSKLDPHIATIEGWLAAARQSDRLHSDHIAHTAHRKPLRRHPGPLRKAERVDPMGARRGLVTRATSSRNGGRHHLGIMGDIDRNPHGPDFLGGCIHYETTVCGSCTSL
ncbi:integrase catalytic domain-containing protein [Bradyrhizobium japonicum]|uniref:integrase catalytic domain-containing protein n=1 Tax=Bradyrhizobium japonicum TaxID=375 RepID=UPI002715260C|nr:transposase family protein [Bradyrhizobium japonicum]WLB18899.1 transposase family protein [Bradyrhizobium japonicum]